jgi:hypothetical protein
VKSVLEPGRYSGVNHEAVPHRSKCPGAFRQLDMGKVMG